MKKLVVLVAVLLSTLGFGSAHAAWNAEWTKRVKINLNTSADGLTVAAPVDGAPVLVRLHTGNFQFYDARPDGADLRFIAADDKTPLKFHIEKFDGLNELALVWVQLPKLAPGSKTDFVWLYYGNPNAMAGGDAKTSYDAAQVLVYHFGERDGLPQDASAAANHATTFTAKPSAAGLIGGAAVFDGAGEIGIKATPGLASTAEGMTVSMWIKPVDLADASLFAQKDRAASLSLQIKEGRLVAQAGTLTATSAVPLTAGTWQHVALVLKDGLALFVSGQEVGKVAGTLPAIAGPVSVGQGFKGELDELQVANVARSPDWLKVAAGSQGPDQKLVAYGQAEGGAEESGPSYIKILLSAVTIDGWVVIAVLMVMFVLSVWVMITKTMFVWKAAQDNDRFKSQFEAMVNSIQSGAQDGAAEKSEKQAARAFRHSPMFRLYAAGVHELRGRFAAYAMAGREPILSDQSLNAIRATIDARMVREMQRLNSQMVLLTISIAGGPFLGLLGTVVGVMITFAAIAAAGDVNVNAIAPGIAAALVATVAGLAVAIPALFGYNYLTGKIQEITSDMQVFVDEFVTRIAENHSV